MTSAKEVNTTAASKSAMLTKRCIVDDPPRRAVSTKCKHRLPRFLNECIVRDKSASERGPLIIFLHHYLRARGWVLVAFW